MEELKSALEAHMDQMEDLVQKLSSELRSGIKPSIDNFVGFFHAIDWKVPFFASSFFKKIKIRVYIEKKLILTTSIYKNLVCFVQEPFLVGLTVFHLLLLILTIVSRKHINFQMSLFLLACKFLSFFLSL